MQPGADAIPEAKVAFRGLLRRKLLAMTSEVAKFLAMTSEVVKFLAMTSEITRFFASADGALVIASRVRHCERSDAIPEAKVACRGLLRRKLLAMTSEVAKFLAMASEITRFFAMAEDTLQGKTSLQCRRAMMQFGKVKFPPVLIPLVFLRFFHTPDFLQGNFSWFQD